MLNYMIINGTSTLDLDILVIKHPLIIKAEKKVTDIIIPGRDGTIYREEEYKNYTKQIELLINDTTRTDEFLNLISGQLSIIFSSELDKVYRCRVKNQIDLSKVLENRRQCLLQLDTYPFKYSADSLNDQMELTKEQVFFNPGTMYSEPIIKIVGSGNVTLDINGKFYEVYPVDESVTINSEIQEVYRAAQNKNNTFVADEFPTFNPGENKISWTGNVAKIEIKPNWRWL